MLGRHPNCYTFTKALSEAIVADYGSKLPICIIRPGIGGSRSQAHTVQIKKNNNKKSKRKNNN